MDIPGPWCQHNPMGHNNASKQNYLLLQGPQKKIFLHNYDYDEVWVPVRCVKNY